MTIPEASGLYLPPLARFATLSQPPLAGRPATATIITVEIVRNPPIRWASLSTRASW